MKVYVKNSRLDEVRKQREALKAEYAPKKEAYMKKSINCSALGPDMPGDFESELEYAYYECMMGPYSWYYRIEDIADVIIERFEIYEKQGHFSEPLPTDWKEQVQDYVDANLAKSTRQSYMSDWENDQYSYKDALAYSKSFL